LLIGQDELERGVVTLRDLEGHQQRELPLASAAEQVIGVLCGNGAAPTAVPKGGRCDP
jgi:hypothetical protein